MWQLLIDYVYQIITSIQLWFSIWMPMTSAWHCHLLYVALSSNVGAWGMWVCSLCLSWNKNFNSYMYIQTWLLGILFVLSNQWNPHCKYRVYYRLDEVDEAYKSISPLHTKLMDLKKENTRYCQVCKEFTDLVKLPYLYTTHCYEVVQTPLLENFWGLLLWYS